MRLDLEAAVSCGVFLIVHCKKKVISAIPVHQFEIKLSLISLRVEPNPIQIYDLVQLDLDVLSTAYQFATLGMKCP